MPRRQRKSKQRIERIVDKYEEQVAVHINREYNQQTSRADIIADKIAEFGGSWKFIITFACILMAWIIWNQLFGSSVRFDPYPFILLNLFLSFTAAFQAPIIMMSQNRQAARDKEELLVDHAIDFKAEQEIDDLQTQMRRVEEVSEMIVKMQHQYEEKFEELKVQNEKSNQSLLELVEELKRSVEDKRQ